MFQQHHSQISLHGTKCYPAMEEATMPRGQSGYPNFPTSWMHSSSTSMATSASSLVTTSGGHRRTELGPQPRKSTPFSKAFSTIRSRSAAAYSLVDLSLTDR